MSAYIIFPVMYANLLTVHYLSQQCAPNQENWMQVWRENKERNFKAGIYKLRWKLCLSMWKVTLKPRWRQNWPVCFPGEGVTFPPKAISGVEYLGQFQIVIFIARFYAELSNPAGTHTVSVVDTTSRGNPTLWQRLLLGEYESWNNVTTNRNVVTTSRSCLDIETTSRQNLTLLADFYNLGAIIILYPKKDPLTDR